MDRPQGRSPPRSPPGSPRMRHRSPPAPSSPCESRQSPTRPPRLEVAAPRTDQPGVTARLVRPSSPDRPSAPSPSLRMAQPAACNSSSCARRSPGLAPHLSARALPPCSLSPPRRAATLHPSPAGLRSSATQAVCTGPACSPPARRLSARQLVHSEPPSRPPAPAPPKRATLHRRAPPGFVRPARCLPRAQVPA